jgi:hypothetical protein
MPNAVNAKIFGGEKEMTAGTLRSGACLRSAADLEVRAPGPAFPCLVIRLLIAAD